MSQLESCINSVLEQLRLELAEATWESRRRYYDQMIRLAKSLGISEPCQQLYNAYVADDGGSKERRSMHIRSVKLLDAYAGTMAKDGDGNLYNMPPLPDCEEIQEQFRFQQYPQLHSAGIDHLIVKAEIEMQHLALSASTMGQYRHAWMDIRRYFVRHGVSFYNEELIHCFIDEIGNCRADGSMKEWKCKILRKAALVLMEVADTGCFQWSLAKPAQKCVSPEIEPIRKQFLASLLHRNLSQSTISLHDYAFRGLMEFAEVQTQNELCKLSAQDIQNTIVRFAAKCLC